MDGFLCKDYSQAYLSSAVPRISYVRQLASLLDFFFRGEIMQLTDLLRDMVHERHPPGYTHLHKDAVPDVGGDLLWASGYAAYSKLSPDFRRFLDGKKAVFVSKEKYLDRNNPSSGRIHSVTRAHPIVRVHPVTGWKSLYIAHGWVSHIVGLDKKESDLILGYLKDIYENNVDIQCRFKWTPGSSAIWDNR